MLRRRRRAAASTTPPAPPGWPPGHFYSPIPDLAAVRRDEARIFADPPRELPGIDLAADAQLELLARLARHHDSVAFRRFDLENPNFTVEGIVLQCLLRELRPERLIEIGSGHSSAAILDTRELFLGGRPACTFVEPHPELLRSLLAPGDEAAVEILAVGAQELDADRVAELGPGDVLVVDSTHVAKVDSDVLHVLFRLLPRLAPGVVVHFHDVLYPFEYPRAWVLEGRAWNEAYLLRAFLAHNGAWEVLLFNSFLARFHAAALAAALPRCAPYAGSSLWLRRRG
jgi:methyltransferase family protein